MVIKTKGKFIKRFAQLLLLGIFCVLQPVMAGLLDPPVITLSLTDCEKAYMVQIFEDGRVEYRGGFGVKVQGWRDAHVNPQDVAALLKKFDEAGAATWDDREDLPGMRIREHGLTAIHLHKGDRELTSFGGKHGTPLYLGIMSVDELRRNHKNLNVTFALLQLEIIRITNLQQWVLDPTQSLCLNGSAIRINSLKTKK
jgi:hypothetical protein